MAAHLEGLANEVGRVVKYHGGQSALRDFHPARVQLLALIHQHHLQVMNVKFLSELYLHNDVHVYQNFPWFTTAKFIHTTHQPNLVGEGTSQGAMTPSRAGSFSSMNNRPMLAHHACHLIGGRLRGDSCPTQLPPKQGNRCTQHMRCFAIPSCRMSIHVVHGSDVHGKHRCSWTTLAQHVSFW